VLGVWPLHGLCGAWGGIAAGIFGAKGLGGLGGVAFMSQLAGTALGVTVALVGGFLVYGSLKAMVGPQAGCRGRIQRGRSHHPSDHRQRGTRNPLVRIRWQYLPQSSVELPESPASPATHRG
jgi:ammonia channel protein AmtB